MINNNGTFCTTTIVRKKRRKMTSLPIMTSLSKTEQDKKKCSSFRSRTVNYYLKKIQTF